MEYKARRNKITTNNIKMDFSQKAKDRIELKHFTWLGFKNVNGALVKEGFDGEIQFYDGNFWYCKDNVGIKKILLNEDIDQIYLAQKYSRNKPLTAVQLGDKLCEHCPLEKKGSYSVDGGYMAGCEGSRCEEAYENYLIEFNDKNTKTEQNDNKN